MCQRSQMSPTSRPSQNLSNPYARLHPKRLHNRRAVVNRVEWTGIIASRMGGNALIGRTQALYRHHALQRNAVKCVEQWVNVCVSVGGKGVEDSSGRAVYFIMVYHKLLELWFNYCARTPSWHDVFEHQMDRKLDYAAGGSRLPADCRQRELIRLTYFLCIRCLMTFWMGPFYNWDQGIGGTGWRVCVGCCLDLCCCRQCVASPAAVGW